MERCFVPKDFIASHEYIIDAANRIIGQYQKEGFDLTLRQLYYQFVALDLFPEEWAVKIAPGQYTKNHERNYKKLGDILNDGRMAGLVDWDAIVDRTRKLQEWYHEESVRDALASLERSYTLDMWETQVNRVEVWVEKEALAGIFHNICARYDVPYFACRGYVSASSSYEAYERISTRYERGGQRTIILHFGDHDPSGIDMTADIERRLNLMLADDGIEDGIEVRRLALNMDQVRRYRPPPSPAKITDSRAKAYIKRFGHDSWELDALNPTQLSDLASAEIEAEIDWTDWDARKALIEAHREQLRGFIKMAEDKEE